LLPKTNLFTMSNTISTPQDQSHISHILTNWSTPYILPPHLPSSPTCIPALSILSDLTPNTPNRAWNLLNTYFQARIREASYTGKHKRIYTTLQVEDVNKAIESAQRMSLGHILMSESGKRKYSTLGEVGNGTEEEECGGFKRVKMGSDGSKDMEGGGDDDIHLTPLPSSFPDLLSQDTNALRPCLTLQIPLSPLSPLAYDDLVAELQRATQEMEFCGRVLEAAEETVRCARVRHEMAIGVAERARGALRRVERKED
jgi:hypothetical protein